jgi:hypothetical protein
MMLQGLRGRRLSRPIRWFRERGKAVTSSKARGENHPQCPLKLLSAPLPALLRTREAPGMPSAPGMTQNSVVATYRIAPAALLDWWVDFADNACYGIANEGR